ncbi:hypothetical protein RCL_jg3918.t2 [Rhizophagus clarus]|uniref:Uncharacterized protein n=1 Tax=Rhizophagus clarus TaxID=94130 RepID=A0A8H3QB92_9GLOM|nr:hypothetical protein RCL_jg3918.t2 [Rhizophagus clarus]
MIRYHHRQLVTTWDCITYVILSISKANIYNGTHSNANNTHQYPNTNIYKKETGASKGSYRESIDSSFSTYGYCINTQTESISGKKKCQQLFWRKEISSGLDDRR